MCLSVAEFFSPRSGGVDVNPDDLILNCYRLADRFHQDPTIFLEMPISQVDRHIYWTVELIKAQRAAQPDDD